MLAYDVSRFEVPRNEGVDATALIQTAIDAAEASGGGIVWLPAGFYPVSAPINISSGIVVQGSGIGSGIGTGNSGGTVIRSVAAAGDVFNVKSNESVVFRDLTIDAPFVTKDGGTSGIRFAGADPSKINQRSRVDNCRIANMHDAIHLELAGNFVLSSSHLQDYRNVGLYTRSIGAGFEDQGGQTAVYGNVFWDLNTGISQACIRYDKGGDLRVTNNKILGGDFGFRMVLDGGPTGTVIISNNSFEQQRVGCVYIQQSGSGHEFGNLVINGNQFSLIFASPTTQQSSVTITAGTPTVATSWIRNVTISDIVFNRACNTPYSEISVQDGEGVMIANNVIDLGGGAAVSGITTGANVVRCHVLDNIINNPASPAQRYGPLSSSTLLRDIEGTMFADMPNTANGSELYVIDGALGSDPLAGGGSGAVAHRLNGAWRS